MTPDNNARLACTEPQSEESRDGACRPSLLIVLIGSVGAEQSLSAVLAGLPSDTPAALAAFPEVRLGFTRLLCERLRTDSRLHIRELTSSDLLTPGSLHVAPAQHGAGWSEEGRGGPIHIEAVKLMERSKETAGRVRDSCSRAIEVFGPHICAVLLSGMADDSVEGARLVKEAGGMVVVQNEATALVWDGPQEAIRNGLADDVLPLWAIGGHLAELAEG